MATILFLRRTHM